MRAEKSIYRVLGLVLTFAFGANAEATTTAALSASTTHSSEITISGTTDPDITWVWVQITKADGSAPAANIFPKLTASSFSQILYIKTGPGDYVLNVLQTKGPNQFGDITQSPYYAVTSLPLTNTDPADRTYSFPSQVVQSDDPSIVALSQTIVAGLTDDMAKSKAVHDWVATHIAYDTAALASGNLGEQSALSTLQAGKAVCSGYARLNAALQRAAGIPVRLIVGTAASLGVSGDHEWDEAQVNGQWIIEDPTWDSGAVDNGVFEFMFTETYFNPTPADFAKDHTETSIATNE